MDNATHDRRGERKPHDLYRIYDEADELLYVGISYSALVRITQHRDSQPWWTKVANVTVERLGVMTRSEAQVLERQVILAEAPLHNVVHNRRLQTTTKAPKPPKTPRDKAHNWRCGVCGTAIPHGAKKGFIQVPRHAEDWECVCKKCDTAETPRYWIDAQRISTVEDVHHWTKHLHGKRWFDSESWWAMIVASCDIKEARYAAHRTLSDCSYPL